MAESEEYWFIIPVLGIGIALWLVFTLRYLFWVPNLDEKHVLVTGGSSGIGKCVAIAAARFGAHVSIIGSDSVKLFAVRKEIMKARKNDTQLVTCTVADVGHLRELEPAMETIVGAVNEVDMLVTCAGFAVCGTFEQVPYFDVNHMIQTNLIGTLNAVRLVVPSMKRRQSGNIVLVGSQVSLMGLYGYSGYACSKFGVRGLGESLQMEVKPYDVQVTLCLPPDTGTPGFETENKSDPDKTKKICSADVLEDPETVAIALIKDALVCLTFLQTPLLSRLGLPVILHSYSFATLRAWNNVSYWSYS